MQLRTTPMIDLLRDDHAQEVIYFDYVLVQYIIIYISIDITTSTHLKWEEAIQEQIKGLLMTFQGFALPLLHAHKVLTKILQTQYFYNHLGELQQT